MRLNEAQQMCVRAVCVDFGNHERSECAGCLDEANLPHVKQLCWYSMFLRSELTTHRAGAIGKPAGPGPCRRNPKTSRHNRSLQTPNGHQRGLRQAPIPAGTISVFRNTKLERGNHTAKEAEGGGEIRKIFKVCFDLSCFKNSNQRWIPQSLSTEDKEKRSWSLKRAHWCSYRWIFLCSASFNAGLQYWMF